MTNKKQIALFFGGRGYEHSVSVSGAKNLLSLIDRERYGVYTIFIEKSGKMRLTTPDLEVGEADLSYDDAIFSCGEALFPILADGRGALLTEAGERFQVDCAFPLLHGDFGEDGTIQGLLASCRIPFVGADTRASAICLDKAATKAFAEALGISTVPWRLLTDGESCSDLEPPLFIKPDCLAARLAHRPRTRARSLVRLFKAPRSLAVAECLQSGL